MLAAVALYAALGIAAFWPQSRHPTRGIAYIGDALESVYLVAWNVHQFFHDPRHQLDANILHPTRAALTLTDHRLLPSLAVAPVIWTTGNAVLATNVAIGLASLLAALGGRHLARRLGADAVAAWSAGALYAFHTYQVNEAPRLNIIFHGFLPFALAELLALLKTGRPRHAWTVAGLMLLQGLSSNYHLLYGTLLLGIVLAIALSVAPRLTLRGLPSLLLAGGAAAFCFLPVALPYLRTARVHGFARELPAGVDLLHYVSTAPGNLVYGPIGAAVRLQQQGPHFVGFVALALTLGALAAWALGRGADGAALVPARLWVPGSAALALALVALSLGRDMTLAGHDLGPGPYRLLHHFVPGFTLVRIPERLALLAMLFIALLTARGLTLLRQAGWGPAASVMALLVPLEHLSPAAAVQMMPVGGEIPAVYAWLRTQPVKALAEVPTRGEGLVRQETIEMYFSTAHFHPIIHGYTAYPPAISRLLRRLADRFPSPVTLQAFQRVGVDTVLVHHGRNAPADITAALRSPGDPESAGRLQRLALFDGPGARLYQSTGDEVLRIIPGDLPRPAPFPAGHRLRSTSWRYRSPVGEPRRAADDDLATSWAVEDTLRGDEWIRVLFDRPMTVSGVILRLQRESVLPTRFVVSGRDPGFRWAALARWDDAHVLQLLDRLLEDPRQGAVGFDLGGRELTGLEVRVEEGGESFDGWSIPELEVWTP